MTKDLRVFEARRAEEAQVAMLEQEDKTEFSVTELASDGLWNRETPRTPRTKNPAREEFRKRMKRCKYCHATDDLTVDHKVPLVLGGKDIPGNWQCLCARCNSMKSNIPHKRLKMLFQWFVQITFERQMRKVKGLWM